jgi:hypothetical protein
MNYVILRNYDHYVIVNDDANVVIGRAQPLNGREGPYRVSAELAPGFENDEVAVVEVIQEAVPALVAHYERKPPVWENYGSFYTKDTQFAVLRVQQGFSGVWLPHRNDYPLLRDGKLAVFATSEEAQSAADAHLLDRFPNSKPCYDGLSWLVDPHIDWRSSPQLVEDRVVWQNMASRWLPDCNAVRSKRYKVLQGGKV